MQVFFNIIFIFQYDIMNRKNLFIMKFNFNEKKNKTDFETRVIFILFLIESDHEVMTLKMLMRLKKCLNGAGSRLVFYNIYFL